jgi:hypothetical protein
MRPRRWAQKMGLTIIKGRASKKLAVGGGFQLRDCMGKVVAGNDYELSAQAVLKYCGATEGLPEAKGVLGQKLGEYCLAENCSMEALTVLANENDPYRHDNERGQPHPAYEAGLERLQEAKRAVEGAIAEARATAHEVEHSFDDLELEEIEPIEVELSDPLDEPFYDSDDDWVEATRKLKERKALVPDGED